MAGAFLMHRFFQILLLLILMSVPFWVTASAEDVDIRYITKYRIESDYTAVYGLFDLGNKPSVRLTYPSLNGGKIRLKLHGRHYVSSVFKPFSVVLAFEDVTGRVFQESARIAFDPHNQNLTPRWFVNLNDIAGIYGNKDIEIAVPRGTSVINFLGSDETPSISPNQLVGYMSHLEPLPAEP